MRLSEWRAAAPNRDAVGPKVAAVIDPILAALGADADPHAWIAWGEEPAVRYTVFVPLPAGLVSCYVRVNVPGEGPRGTAKLIRWNRVQLGELGIETQGGHRLLSFQVEQQVLRGADDQADQIAGFAMQLFAAIDGRPMPELPARAGAGKRGAGKGPSKAGASKAGAGRAAGATAKARPVSKPATRSASTALTRTTGSSR